jgi:hypothetical protein
MSLYEIAESHDFVILAQGARHSFGADVELGGPICEDVAASVAITTGGTITTAGVGVAVVAPAAAVTGVILQAGTVDGQTITVLNTSVAGNTVTFAAASTSLVADGTSSVIAGLTARRFVWNAAAGRWFPVK